MNVISINPSFNKVISEINVLKPKGRITLVNPEGENIFNERISIFYVDTQDFHFHLGVADDGIFIQRNNYQCVVSSAEILDYSSSVFILTWNTMTILKKKLPQEE